LLEVKLKLKVNFEFESLILSYGERLKVIGPEKFAKMIEQRLESAVRNYHEVL
jgi:predicted DNA-binding transcriptional regulator YafY